LSPLGDSKLCFR